MNIKRFCAFPSNYERANCSQVVDKPCRSGLGALIKFQSINIFFFNLRLNLEYPRIQEKRVFHIQMPIKRGKPVFGQLHRGFMTFVRRVEEERVGNTGDVYTLERTPRVHPGKVTNYYSRARAVCLFYIVMLNHKLSGI